MNVQDWFPLGWTGDFLAVQETLKRLLQHHSSKASLLWHSAFFQVQLSHLYMTMGKTIALTRRTFVDKVMSLLLNRLSRLVITFLPRSKHLLISWCCLLTIFPLRKRKTCFKFTLLWGVKGKKHKWGRRKEGIYLMARKEKAETVARVVENSCE